MDSNTIQFGLSWHLWLRETKNQKLFDKDSNEALKQFKLDGEAHIHDLMLQERIILERQRQIILDLEKQSYESNKTLLEAPSDQTTVAVAAVASAGVGGASKSLQKNTPEDTSVVEILTEDGKYITTENGVYIITE